MNNPNKLLIRTVVVIALAIVAYRILTMPDQRTPMEKIGDAIHDLPKGADKAERQLESRTPGQKLGDAIKDNTTPPSSSP